MSLRYIVPSLGLIACAAGTATAADVGGLTINGYVDTVLEISSIDDDLRGIKDGTVATVNDDEAANVVIDWSAAAQLEVGYAIGDVNANIEVYWEDGGDVILEQAYADWMVNEQFDIKMGRFHSGIGWEEYDAPDLNRINMSILEANGLLGNDLDGVRAGFKANDMFGGGLTFADAIYDQYVWPLFVDVVTGAGGTIAADAVKDNDEFAVLADAKVVAEGIGTFKGTLAFDMGNGYDLEEGESDDVLGIDVNGTIDALTESQGMTFGFDLNYTSAGWADFMGILATGMYTINDMASVSLTIGYVSIDVDDPVDESASEMEIAVALLTMPTQDENFALNVEGRYISRDYEDLTGSDDLNEFGVFLEMIAQIP